VEAGNKTASGCIMAIVEAAMAPKPHSQPRPGPRQSPGAGVLLCGVPLQKVSSGQALLAGHANILARRNKSAEDILV
jgi:hypothetical protein